MPHLILVWSLQSPKSKVQTSNEWRGFQILMKQTFYNNQNKYHLVTNHHVASHKITTVNFHKNPTYKNTNNFPTHQIKLTYTFPHLTSSLSSDFNPHFIFFTLFFSHTWSSSSSKMAITKGGSRSKMEKKEIYSAKLRRLIDDYSKVLIVLADNVGSNQLQQIRQGLRGDSIVLMGKNTLMKRALKTHMDETGNKAIKPLMNLLVVNFSLSSCFWSFFLLFVWWSMIIREHINMGINIFLWVFLGFCLIFQGNVGLIFTKGDLKEVSEELGKYKV